MTRIIILFPLLLCSLLSLAQEIDPKPQAYLVGQAQGSEYQLVSARPTQQQALAQRVRDALPRPSQNEWQWRSEQLVNTDYAGWMYEVQWEDGPDTWTARFELITRQGDLYLLSVGTFQLCHCIDCGTGGFQAQGRGCACGADCEFLAGSTLH